MPVIFKSITGQKIRNQISTESIRYTARACMWRVWRWDRDYFCHVFLKPYILMMVCSGMLPAVFFKVLFTFLIEDTYED